MLVGSVLTGNAALAATQQLRAERLLQRLLAVQDPPGTASRRAAATATGYETLPALDLRPGDVIEVRPGEVVPADARIVEAIDMEVDESALTGESLPVTKQVEPTPAAPLAERACMLHASTTVVAGTAVGVVTAVGRAAPRPGGRRRRAEAAELGSRVAGAAARTDQPGVAVQPGRRRAGQRSRPAAAGGLRQAVASGVAVSVAAVPEGLPLVATLAQQASARRLTRVGALVRSTRSVEALGRVDVVCFDKTGTLSENRLRVTRIAAAAGFLRRAGARRTRRGPPPPANGDGHEHATDAAVAEAADSRCRRLRTGAGPPAVPVRTAVLGVGLRATCCRSRARPEAVLAACDGRRRRTWPGRSRAWPPTACG